MASAYGPLPPSRPLSPWAARYSTRVPTSYDAVFKRGPFQHSSMAPEPLGSPSLDPIFFADKPRTEGVGAFSHGYEIDRLFFSEHAQDWERGGCKAWQFGVAHKTLKFAGGEIPGGHQEEAPSAFKDDPASHPGWISRQLYDYEMIKPDEESWFSFLRKDRWLNWSNGAPLLGGGPWSVDNPLVWEALSPSLDCANRVLRALIQDQHPILTTLLFGTIRSWEEMAELLATPDLPPAPFPTATVLLSYDRFRQYRNTCDDSLKDMERLPFIPPDDHIARLEELMDPQIWSFHDSLHAPGYGVTNPNVNSVISLHVDILALLIEGKITLAERCLLQFMLVSTIVHEMGHAIINRRCLRVFGEDNYNFLLNEPFVDFAAAAEMGHVLDVAIWGGTFSLGQQGGGPDQPPVGFFSENWPLIDRARGGNGRGVFAQEHPDFFPGRNIERELLPVEFASKVLSKAFWIDPNFPRKSDNSFHRSRLFISKTPYLPGSALVHYANPIAIEESLGPNQLSPTEKAMIQDWKEREALWDSLRAGWYQEHRDTWVQTTWSDMTLRSHLCLFSEHHKKADFVICSQLADRLADWIPWYPITSREEYVHHIEAGSRRLIPHILGLLMMAAIPIRRGGELSPWALNIRGPERWTLSEGAREAGRNEINIVVQAPTGGIPLTPSRFDNPLNQGAAPVDYSHLHYLDMVRGIMSHLAAAQKQLPTPWLREIMRVESSLRQEIEARRQVILLDHHREFSWSRSWDFEVPEYDPDAMCLWVDGEWVDA